MIEENGQATVSLGDPTPAEAAIQDPLPETKWLWRRVYVFVVTGVAIIGLWTIGNRIAEFGPSDPKLAIGAFLSMYRWMLLFLWFMVTYYLVAPSAEQVVKMWQTAGMLKSGVSLTSSASASSPTSTATSTMAAGPATGAAPASVDTTTGDVGAGPPPPADRMAWERK